MDHNHSSEKINSKYDTTAVVQDENGKYHWIYTYSMWENYSMLRPVLIGLGISFLVILVIILAALHQSGRDTGYLVKVFLLYLGIVLVILLITVLSYALVAAFYGGKYVSLYEMDSEGLSHYQPSSQADKERAIGLFAAAAGFLGGNAGTTIAGLTAGSRLVVRAEFPKIKSLKIVSDKEEIRVHSFMTWHTVHVPRESFEFVADYMTSHCVNAKIKIY